VVRFFGLLALAWCAQAATGVPADLRATLVSLREHAASSESRGATPQLTVAKHQLRDWIETNLAAFGERGDASALAPDLNQALINEKLVCAFDDAPGGLKCPEEIWLGFLEPVRIRREGQYLVVTTSVGIECGFDESVYLYECPGGVCHRRWENEQVDYAPERYHPQNIESFQIAGSDEKGGLLVMTLGIQPWCSSNWRNVYYRLSRAGAQTNQLLLDGSEVAFVEAGIQGSLRPDEVLIEYGVSSVDKGVLIRETVQHYRISAGNVERTAPIALSPRDFVDEWLSANWSVGVSWSEAALKEWHQRLHSDSPNGEFVGATMHCSTRPDLWQVGIDLDPADHKGDAVRTYFLVRWRPPYRFSMVSVGRRAFAGCTEKDPDADSFRTLFPGRYY
jgi:hypothetical protein